MAVALEKTYVVNNLSRAFDDQVVVTLVEHQENEDGSPMIFTGFGNGGNLTVNVSSDDATKFLPGQLFKVALTPVKSA